MGAVTPGETLGTLYNIHVGSNKTKQHNREKSQGLFRVGSGAADVRSLLLGAFDAFG